MKKILAVSALAFGVLLSSNAMAIHQCGQLLGSCLPHLPPTPIVKPTPVPAPVPIVVEPARPKPIVTPIK